MNKRKGYHAIAMSGEAYDPFIQLAALPMGGIFILRHYAAGDRRGLAGALLRAARRQRKLLLIAQDAALAYQLHADGVHYPEWQLNRLRRVERRKPDWLVSASAHSLTALCRAARAGADWAILSPVLIAKPRALGVCRLAGYARQAGLPVYALGGIASKRGLRRLAPAPIAGFAAQRGFAFRAI